ncbi:hypothetical protein FUT69_07995 [Xylella taiwanensis]|uniref:Uncharacterized protein n=1 Tax=Xylella taiwanensis TaxID=1444770 RepID=A0ABS8TYU8_9GAMM|nr:hypothetical protein [Xylella taiwanensis]MCD8456731.1 hypothetical protein [Xylella taiwanensis]MCD8459140.1 hypothetical protein [Xylella taiwanensis]MCD8461967.1 hypothetical protein [Xylella taiwanensis]MCD8464230.1 hypothetical protein [Xylella taiwanensis]MCD8465785.1 hypothetical protein [Xylella taiwanensis]
MKALRLLLEEILARRLPGRFLQCLRVLVKGMDHRLIACNDTQDQKQPLERRIASDTHSHRRVIAQCDQDHLPNDWGMQQHLMHVCHTSGTAAYDIVHIAWWELQSCYPVLFQSLEHALEIGTLARHQGKRRCRSSNAFIRPSRTLNMLPRDDDQKVTCARQTGQFAVLDHQHCSHFFNMIASIKRFEAELLERPV